MPAKAESGPIGGLRALYRKSSEARWALSSQVMTSGGNFATTVIIIRSLGLAEFGRFSVVFLIMMMIRNFLNGVVLTPMSSISPKLKGTSARAYRGFLLANAALFSVLSSFLVFVGAEVFGNTIGVPWLSELAIASALANLFANAADFFRRYLFVQVKSGHAFLVDVVRYIVQLVLVTIFALTSLVEFGAAAALYAVALGGFVAMIFGAMAYGAMSWRRRLNQAMWSRHLNFIRWLIPGVALEAVQANAPIFVGGALIGEAGIGVVRAVQQLANILSMPTNALQQVAPSIASKALANSGIDKARAVLLRLGQGGMAVLVISAIAPLILWDYATEYLFNGKSSNILFIYIAYMVNNFVTLLKVTQIIFVNSLEKPNFMTESALIAVILTFISIFPLVHFFGLPGIPATSLLANIFAMCVLAVRVRQAAKIGFDERAKGGRAQS